MDLWDYVPSASVSVNTIIIIIAWKNIFDHILKYLVHQLTTSKNLMHQLTTSKDLMHQLTTSKGETGKESGHHTKSFRALIMS